MRTTFSPPTSPKIRLSLAALLVGCAASAHAQQFLFATQAQAREILSRQDEYVLATAPLERSVMLRTTGPVTPQQYAAAMGETAREWTEEERRAVGEALGRLERFVGAMRWKAPATILLIKASSRLMDGFPHTRANAIILQEPMLRDALAKSELMDYLLAHEAFHVLTRADPGLRDELYAAIGFRRCATSEIPAATARLRVTNPDEPPVRYTIRVGQGEVMPLAHFGSDAIDHREPFMKHVRVSWLRVERRDGHCAARDAGRLDVEELHGFYEQVGRNTAYVIHPEEILADNFALLYRADGKLRSPEIVERIAGILRP